MTRWCWNMDFFFLILFIESHDLKTCHCYSVLPLDVLFFQALSTWLACDKEDINIIQLKLARTNSVQMLLQKKLVKAPIQPPLSLLLLHLLHFAHKFQNQHHAPNKWHSSDNNSQHQWHTNGLDYKHLYFI